MVPVTGHIRSENHSYTQRPDVDHVQMVWRSYGGKPVPIFWITMNRPGPLGNAQTNEPVNHDAYNSKAQ